MLPNDSYLSLDAQGRVDGAHSTSAEFLLRCLLGAREEAEFPSNERGFDEDVNVYVVGLLQRFLSPQYHSELARYIQLYDTDLARDIARRDDDRHTYRVYKTNADHLLLAVGLFRHVPGAHHEANPLAHREPEAFIGRGGIYYQLASSSLRRLRRRTGGTEAALDKLAARFGDYADVLQRVRVSYFHLTARLSEGTLFHLGNGSIEPGASTPELIADLYDDFLDAFSAWKEDPSAKTRESLYDAAHSLEAVDESFSFRLPEGEDDDLSRAE